MNKYSWMVPTEIKNLRSWQYFRFYITELKNVVISCLNDGESKFSFTDTEAKYTSDTISMDTLRITSADTESASNREDLARQSVFIVKTGKIEVQSTADRIACWPTSSTVVPEQHSSLIQACPSKSLPDLYMYNSVYQVYTVRETLHEQRFKRAKSMEDCNLSAQSSQDTVIYKPKAKHMQKEYAVGGNDTAVNISSDLAYRVTWADKKLPVKKRRSEEMPHPKTRKKGPRRPKEDHRKDMTPQKRVIISEHLMSRTGAKCCAIFVILLILTHVIMFIVLAQYWHVYRAGFPYEPGQNPRLRENLYVSYQSKVPDDTAYSRFLSGKLGPSDGRLLEDANPLFPPSAGLVEPTKITRRVAVAVISTTTMSLLSPSPLSDLEDDEPEPPVHYQNSLYG